MLRSVVSVWAAAWAAGCGSAMSVEGEACPRVGGKFSARYTLLETDGTCGQAKAMSVDALEFDAQGFVSPLGDLTKCSTSQLDCAVSVSCTTHVVNARLDFRGTLSDDGRELSGTAVLEGSYAGCRRVIYAVHATAAE